MLKSILSPNTCAKCRICCSFVSADAWETPVFTSNSIDYNKKWFKRYGNKSHTLHFFFENDTEIKLCPYLDENSGCVLSEEDKPFDCKIWPIRVMRKDDKIIIALAKICKGIGVGDIEKVKNLLEESLYDKILKEIKIHPDIVKEYSDEYIEIKTYDGLQ